MSKNAEDNFVWLPIVDHPIADQSAAACDARKKQIQQPHLGLVPLPELRVEERDIDFQMEVGVSEKSEPASEE